jgi:hypothetical protein
MLIFSPANDRLNRMIFFNHHLIPASMSGINLSIVSGVTTPAPVLTYIPAKPYFYTIVKRGLLPR